MELDDLFKALISELAAELGLELVATRAGYYLLSKGDTFIGLSTFVDRDSKLKILMSLRLDSRPIDLGNYAID